MCNSVGARYRIFRRLSKLAAGSAAGARAPKACAPRLRYVHRTGRVPRPERRVSRANRIRYLDAVLTFTVFRRQKGTPQDFRGTPAPPTAGPQTRAQALHQGELLAHQQLYPRRPLARPLQTTPTWQVYARRILLGHGYAGQ